MRHQSHTFLLNFSQIDSYFFPYPLEPTSKTLSENFAFHVLFFQNLTPSDPIPCHRKLLKPTTRDIDFSRDFIPSFLAKLATCSHSDIQRSTLLYAHYIFISNHTGWLTDGVVGLPAGWRESCPVRRIPEQGVFVFSCGKKKLV